MKNSTKPICGAKAKQTGKPCEKPPLKGKTRCRLHGGKTPQGKHTGPMTHGLYSASLSPAEKETWDTIPLDTLDDEIRMTRIWLARAGALDYEISQNPNSASSLTGFELAEIRRSSDDTGVGRTDSTSKRPDLWARKDRLLGRLAQLLKTRAELIVAAGERGEGTDDKARQVAMALRAMIEVETIAPDDEQD